MKDSSTGWLIEHWNSNGGIYLSEWFDIKLEDALWTKESNQALRFSRKEDAEAVINYFGWTEAMPTEHQWG